MKNPLVTIFLSSNAVVANKFSLYNLTAGRISTSGEVLKFNPLDLTPFGSGYHSIIYDNGFLYIIKHVGIVGLLAFMILALFSLMSPQYFSSVSSFSGLLLAFIIYICLLLVVIGGSVLTLHKSSIFLISTLMYIPASRSNMVMTSRQ